MFSARRRSYSAYVAYERGKERLSKWDGSSLGKGIRVRYLQVADVAESGQDSCAVKFGPAAYAFVQSEDAWLELLELFAFAQDHSS